MSIPFPDKQTMLGLQSRLRASCAGMSSCQDCGVLGRSNDIGISVASMTQPGLCCVECAHRSFQSR